MKGWLLTCICLLGSLLPVDAQQINVEDFTRLKRPFWKRSKVTVDKQLAIMDLYSSEKGFQFTADGKTAVEAEEGEGVITLKVPHKTRFLTIKHPDYGQTVWRVPKKYLKKKKHYRATLDAYDPLKEYKVQKQWVLFRLWPKNVILTVDSIRMRLQETDVVQQYLAVGMHHYTVEAPFYEAVTDSFELTDSVKLEIPVRLQPFYSYLTVKVPWKGADVYIDHVLAKNAQTTSQRLSAGVHHVALFWGPDCYYENMVVVDSAAKKVLDIKLEELRLRRLKKQDRVQTKTVVQDATPDSTTSSRVASKRAAGMKTATVYAPVTLHVADDSTEVWIDRAPMGRGDWQGQLAQGFHLVTTRKDGQESVPTYLWVENDFPVEMNLAVPQTSYGLLNIHSNVIGAKVFINGRQAGVTPCVVQGIDASRVCEICLQKEGFKEKKQKVRPKRNDLLNVYFKLKKK